MKSIYLLLLSSLLFVSTIANSQSTEVFEDESVGSSSFTDDGETFVITSSEGFDVNEFTNGGWNGTSIDHKFIDNTGGTTSNVDVYINGSFNNTTANDGSTSYSVSKNSSYTFKVCEEGSATVCTNEITL